VVLTEGVMPLIECNPFAMSWEKSLEYTETMLRYQINIGDV